jgi:hypothetical protein
MPLPPYPASKEKPMPDIDQATKDAVAALPGALAPGFKPRAVTPISSTDSLPTATMITVPSVRSSGEMPAVRPGGEPAPVVGANTVSKFLDPVFMLNAFLCASGVLTAVFDVLPNSGPIDWRITGPKLLLAIFGAVTSFLRHRTNTVTR